MILLFKKIFSLKNGKYTFLLHLIKKSSLFKENLFKTFLELKYSYLN